MSHPAISFRLGCLHINIKRHMNRDSEATVTVLAPPLKFSTFCHVLATNVNVFYWDFMW